MPELDLTPVLPVIVNTCPVHSCHVYGNTPLTRRVPETPLREIFEILGRCCIVVGTNDKKLTQFRTDQGLLMYRNRFVNVPQPPTAFFTCKLSHCLGRCCIVVKSNDIKLTRFRTDQGRCLIVVKTKDKKLTQFRTDQGFAANTTRRILKHLNLVEGRCRIGCIHGFDDHAAPVFDESTSGVNVREGEGRGRLSIARGDRLYANNELLYSIPVIAFHLDFAQLLRSISFYAPTREITYRIYRFLSS
ncbi:hypothetical protein J6590_064754 [Homalodisca vitripennis]|nr:hypothetical protein J6590_064754 [Homalodisca vitripennis]